MTLSFQIDSVAVANRGLTENGLTPTAIRYQVMDADFFNLYDPEGTRIEL